MGIDVIATIIRFDECFQSDDNETVIIIVCLE